jgi:hypothetical protein
MVEPVNHPEPQVIDARTRLRIVSVELNEATAELYKARHDVLYRRLRMFPARRHIPAWAAALVIGGIGAGIGAIPAMLVRGDNVLFVFVAVLAAYTILSPATLLLLADREAENDSNRLQMREEAMSAAMAQRDALEKRVAALHEQLQAARDAVEAGEREKRTDQPPDRPGSDSGG